MGWWETINGEVLGDAALDVLDAHAQSRYWKAIADVPPKVLNTIVKTYHEGLGRAPTPTELETLLIYHRGNNTRRDEPGPTNP